MNHQCINFIKFQAKCSDMSCTTYKDLESEGYVPSGLGIGGGDYVHFSYCTDCGKLKDFTPLTQEEIAEALE